MRGTVNTAVGPEMFTTASGEPLAILRELFEHLQDYAPVWYTEELHNRTNAVLSEAEFEPAV